MRLNNYLKEAVIKPANLDDIRDRIKRVFFSLPGKKGVGDAVRENELVKRLTKALDDFNIEFHLEYDAQDEILGSTFPEDGIISIEIGTLRISDSSDDKLIKDIMSVIKHELVHREQLKRSGGKSADRAKTLDFIDADNIDTYLADKMEIMAYAAHIVDILKNEGYKEDQIVDMLRNPKKWMTKIVKSEAHLEVYMNIFDKNSATIKQLKKYIVEYLDKPYKVSSGSKIMKKLKGALSALGATPLARRLKADANYVVFGGFK